MAQLAFDTQFYLSTYPDVAVAISRGQFANAQQHYDLFGRFEGRNPNQFFDTTFYLVSNPDVAGARVNPFQHFLSNGAAEGRFATASADSAIDTNNNNVADEFNATAYLAANQDVANNVGPGKAFATAYQHYVLFGQFETRAGTPAGGPFTNGSAAPGVGATVVLTDKIDVLTGTNGNDTFVGDATTASAADTINGGAGIDTLNLVGSTGAAIPQLSNVEALTFTAPTGAVTANVSAIAGLNAVGIVNTAVASTFTIGATQDVGYINVTGTAAQTVITTATDTAVTINAYNSTTGAIDVQGAALTTLNVVNNGTAASTIASLGSTTAAETTINLAGSQGITITAALADSVTKVDASANTGGVNVTVGTSDISVTGGAGNDKFVFAGTLTTADTIVGGAGTDTVSVAGADYSAVAANGTLAALNTKMTGVEVVEFTGGATTVNGTTFTNTEVTKLLFNTTAADVIDNAGSSRTYSFGDDNTGAATINLASGNNTVKVSLESTTAGADIGNLTVNANAAAPAGQASIVNIASIGGGTTVNTTGTLTAAAGSTFNITGSHDVTITSLTNGGTVDASSFTGKLVVTGSAANDVIIGGSGNDIIDGGLGINTIDLSKGGTDIIRFGQTAAANRDIVTGFQAGANGDILDVGAQTAAVTGGTDDVGTAQFKEFTAAGSTVTFATANTVNELAFNATNNSANLANALDGTELLKAVAAQGSTVTSITTQAAGDAGTIIAYQNGNAYVYHYDASANTADTAITANEISLVGVLNNVAVGALTHDNFA